MSRLPLVISNLHGNYISNIDLEINKISCIVGNSGKDKDEIEELILRKINCRYIRIIPKYRINVPLSVSEVLSLYEKKFGKRNEFILNFLGLDKKRKVTDLTEFEKFKLELSQVAFGKTKLLLVENFMETFEEQLKSQAIKLIIKTANLLDFAVLFFFSNMEFIDVCERVYVIYGGKLLEYSIKSKEFYHPYSMTLKKSILSIGKNNERVEVSYVGEPSLRGCPFHDYCEFVKKDRKLFRICVSLFPPRAIINQNEVFCWLYSPRK
ncbi:hypothetical protein SJAV_00850 [Sulfurisphaera javensis]|uniref:ABC transporter ATP-binding protein n=1 Tax=Sulfurisphaera javensis TaxID=2049879 RepID=A0AAT9GMU6_9CREN